MSSLNKVFTLLATAATLLAACYDAAAQNDGGGSDSGSLLQWSAGTTVNMGSGDFAPYYITSLTHGTVTQSKGWLVNGLLKHEMDTSRRFSWGAGLQIYAGVASKTEYEKWNAEGATSNHAMHPAYAWLQQLYVSVKYRSLFLEAGMRERSSALLDNSLTSGDWVESGNARPVPQIRLGFIDFRDIPLTKGWLQIQGELAYGKFVDNGWIKKFYSRGTSHINLGSYYLYRRLYFRTKPSENLSLTIGMQAAGQIGGETQWWQRGMLTREEDFKVGFGKLLASIIPYERRYSKGEFVDGNNLGSWDVHLRYRVPGGDNGEIKAYLQKPWEKGSSLGWFNGWDGLWGAEYVFASKVKYVEAVLLEYIYLMNQSGPVHFSPHDFPGTTIGTDSQGRDDYYNNNEYNAYSNYGVGMGSPFLKAPLYNTDGYPQYVDNLVRGFHLAARGRIAPLWRWKVALSYRQAFGNGAMTRKAMVDDFSWLLQVEGQLKHRPALRIKVQVAGDSGKLLGNNFGVLAGISYHGNIGGK